MKWTRSLGVALLIFGCGRFLIADPPQALRKVSADDFQKSKVQIVGSTGIPHGTRFDVEVEFDEKAGIKSLVPYRVLVINGQPVAEAQFWRIVGRITGEGRRTLTGIQCTEWVGDPNGRSALPFQCIETFFVLGDITPKKNE